MRIKRAFFALLAAAALLVMAAFAGAAWAEDITLNGEVGSTPDIRETVLVVDGAVYSPTVSGAQVNFSVPGTLPDNTDIALKFPCPVTIKNPDFGGAVQNMKIMLEPDAQDPAVVHLKPVFTLSQDIYYSGLDRLAWPGGEFTLGWISLKNFVSPADGSSWAAPPDLVAFSFAFRFEARPPELIASVPANGSTIHASANGQVGYNLGNVYTGTVQSCDTVMAFFFRQPVKVLDTARIAVKTVSPAGVFEGNMGNTPMMGSQQLPTYTVSFNNVFAPGFFGRAMVDATCTVTFEPGSLEVNGVQNAEPITITFNINPSQKGEIKDNPPPPTPKEMPTVAGEVWRKQINAQWLWGPVKGDGVVYLAGDGLYCFSDGGELLWSQPGEFSNPVLGHNGVVYVVYRAPAYADGVTRDFYLRGYNADGSLRFETYIPGWVGVEPDTLFGGVCDYFESRNNLLQVDEAGNLKVYCIANRYAPLEPVYYRSLLTYLPDGDLVKVEPDAPRPEENLPVDFHGVTIATAKRYYSFIDGQRNKYYLEYWYEKNGIVESVETADYILAPGNQKINLGDKTPEELGLQSDVSILVDLAGTDVSAAPELTYDQVAALGRPYNESVARMKDNIVGVCPGSVYVLVKMSYGDFALVKYDTLDEVVKPVRLEVRPSEAVVKIGESAQYKAIAIFPDNSESDVTAEATWGVSEPQIASVATGLATGLRPGWTDVTAAWQGLTARAKLGVVEVILPPPPDGGGSEQPVPLTGTVFGYVKTADGTPIQGARVELHSDPRIAYTDAAGYYEFRDVPLGEHTVIISDLNWQAKDAELARIDLVLYEKNGQVVVENATSGEVALSEDRREARADFVAVSRAKETPPPESREPEPEPDEPEQPAPELEHPAVVTPAMPPAPPAPPASPTPEPEKLAPPAPEPEVKPVPKPEPEPKPVRPAPPVEKKRPWWPWLLLLIPLILLLLRRRAVAVGLEVDDGRLYVVRHRDGPAGAVKAVVTVAGRGQDVESEYLLRPGEKLEVQTPDEWYAASVSVPGRRNRAVRESVMR